MKNNTSQSCQSEFNPQKYFWEMPLRKLSLIYKYSLFLRWTGFFAGFTISLHSSIVLYSTLEQILTNYKNTSILLKNLFMLFVFFAIPLVVLWFEYDLRNAKRKQGFYKWKIQIIMLLTAGWAFYYSWWNITHELMTKEECTISDLVRFSTTLFYLVPYVVLSLLLIVSFVLTLNDLLFPYSGFSHEQIKSVYFSRKKIGVRQPTLCLKDFDIPFHLSYILPPILTLLFALLLILVEKR